MRPKQQSAELRDRMVPEGRPSLQPFTVARWKPLLSAKRMKSWLKYAIKTPEGLSDCDEHILWSLSKELLCIQTFALVELCPSISQ